MWQTFMLCSLEKFALYRQQDNYFALQTLHFLTILCNFSRITILYNLNGMEIGKLDLLNGNILQCNFSWFIKC